MKDDKIPEGAPEGWIDDDWNTPASDLDRVRQVAPIGLDPCSNSTSLVHAVVEFRLDRGENGLQLLWGGHGLVFVNMPYSRKLFVEFSEKIGYEASIDTPISALPPANIETAEWQDVYWQANAICFPRGRVRFWAGGQEQGTPRRANAFCYFGPYPQRVYAAFESRGVVLMPARRLDVRDTSRAARFFHE